MCAWRRLLLPGLLPSEADALLCDLVAQDGVEHSNVSWRDWHRRPDRPEVAWYHRVTASGLPFTWLDQRPVESWAPRWAVELSDRSGGWVLAGENDQRRSTCGFVLCHGGRVVQWRRQAQEPGLESRLLFEIEQLWGNAVTALLGVAPFQVLPEDETPLRIASIRPSAVPVRRPTDIGSDRWFVLAGALPEGTVGPGLRICQRLTEPLCPPIAKRITVVGGAGTEPAPEVLARIRAADGDAVLLKPPAHPEQAAGLAQALGTSPGIFVDVTGLAASECDDTAGWPLCLRRG